MMSSVSFFYLQFLSLLSYAVIAYGCAECPKLSCGREGCDTEFCYHCRQLWHPNQTCDQARRQRARHTSGGNDASTLYVFNEEPGGGETTSYCHLLFLSLFQTLCARNERISQVILPGSLSHFTHCLINIAELVVTPHTFTLLLKMQRRSKRALAVVPTS